MAWKPILPWPRQVAQSFSSIEIVRVLGSRLGAEWLAFLVVLLDASGFDRFFPILDGQNVAPNMP